MTPLLFDRPGRWNSGLAGQSMLSDQFPDLQSRIDAAAPRAADLHSVSRGAQDEAGFMAMNTFHPVWSEKFYPHRLESLCHQYFS